MNYIDLAVGLISASSFAVLFQVPRKYFFLTVSLGLIAVFLKQTIPEDLNIVYGTFFIAICISILSQILARITNSPTQGFLVPGLIILVPGVHLYSGLSALIISDSSTLLHSLFVAMTTASSISIGILMANLLVPYKWDL